MSTEEITQIVLAPPLQGLDLAAVKSGAAAGAAEAPQTNEGHNVAGCASAGSTETRPVGPEASRTDEVLSNALGAR